MAPHIKLTYFDIEGAAESVRLALALAGVKFEDNRVKFADWPELKPKMPYGQLPVMNIDGGPDRTQSGAMLRYVGTLEEGKSKSLYPTDKIFDVEEAIGLVQDMGNAWSPNLYIAMKPTNFGYPEGWANTDEGKAKIAEMRKTFIADHLPKYLGFLADKIDKSGGKWLVEGDGPTIADCLAVQILRSLTKGVVDYVDPNCLDCNPKIVAYVKRFCALPEIKGRYTNGLY